MKKITILASIVAVLSVTADAAVTSAQSGDYSDTHYGSDDNVQHCANKEINLISPVSGPPPKEMPKNPTAKQQRLQRRRENQETPEWRDDYRIRAGIEGTNSAIKRKTGLDRLRVRGALSVDYTILMKIAGWNVLRAACSKKMRRHLRAREIQKLLVEPISTLVELITDLFAPFRVLSRSRRAFC
jgi:hypothetical protein